MARLPVLSLLSFLVAAPAFAGEGIHIGELFAPMPAGWSLPDPSGRVLRVKGFTNTTGRTSPSFSFRAPGQKGPLPLIAVDLVGGAVEEDLDVIAATEIDLLREESEGFALVHPPAPVKVGGVVGVGYVALAKTVSKTGKEYRAVTHMVHVKRGQHAYVLRLLCGEDEGERRQDFQWMLEHAEFR